MNHDPNDRLSTADQPNTAAKDADIAVRRSLVEGRQHILNFLRRRLGDPEAAEDVLQTFMLRAIDRSEQLRDVRAVRGWLGQILASSIADYVRKVSRRRQRTASKTGSTKNSTRRYAIVCTSCCRRSDRNMPK